VSELPILEARLRLIRLMEISENPGISPFVCRNSKLGAEFICRVVRPVGFETNLAADFDAFDVFQITPIQSVFDGKDSAGFALFDKAHNNLSFLFDLGLFYCLNFSASK